MYTQPYQYVSLKKCHIANHYYHKGGRNYSRDTIHINIQNTKNNTCNTSATIDVIHQHKLQTTPLNNIMTSTTTCTYVDHTTHISHDHEMNVSRRDDLCDRTSYHNTSSRNNNLMRRSIPNELSTNFNTNEFHINMNDLTNN